MGFEIPATLAGIGVDHQQHPKLSRVLGGGASHRDGQEQYDRKLREQVLAKDISSWGHGATPLKFVDAFLYPFTSGPPICDAFRAQLLLLSQALFCAVLDTGGGGAG